MRRNSHKLRKSRYYSLVFSTMVGLLHIFLLILLFGYARSQTDMPDVLVSVLLSLIICSGGLLSGYLYGKNKRRKGILNGVVCGSVIYTAIFIFGIFYLKALPPLRLLRFLIMLCISGAVGGVAGVNSRINKPPF